MLKGLNHVTLAVSDLQRSLAFYVDVLGMTPLAEWNDGAYLSLGGLWFCLSVDAVAPAQDYSHLAFDIEPADFKVFRQRLADNGVPEWKENRSEGDSIYFLDPDGHKLEVHLGTLETRLKHLNEKPYDGLKWR